VLFLADYDVHVIGVGNESLANFHGLSFWSNFNPVQGLPIEYSHQNQEIA
jgi:hypothetical protein